MTFSLRLIGPCSYVSRSLHELGFAQAHTFFENDDGGRLPAEGSHFVEELLMHAGVGNRDSEAGWKILDSSQIFGRVQDRVSEQN